MHADRRVNLGMLLGEPNASFTRLQVHADADDSRYASRARPLDDLGEILYEVRIVQVCVCVDEHFWALINRYNVDCVQSLLLLHLVLPFGWLAIFHGLEMFTIQH